MVVIDEVLAQRARAGRPIRLSVVGFGFMGRAIARQIALATPGTELASIVCRDLAGARTAARDLGLDPALCTADSAAAVADSSLDAVSKPPAAWITESKSCCAPSNNATTSSS